GKSILLVEDNEINSKIIFYMLKKAGYKVTIARNGQECLDFLQNAAFDLILMDMQMPILDGYETTKLIRLNKAWNNIPIIALTAFAMPDTAEKCIRVGCNYYLSKPVSALELIDTIYTFLNNEKKEHLNSSDKEIIKTLIPEFLYTTKLLLKKLQLAADSKNLKSAASIGYDLKGICGMYGFTDLLDMATLVYNDALNGDSENLQTSITKLNHRFLIELKKAST
ncbi:MAG TPA: response regulator, partial [Syntrophomonadaceae bacterium]|nr:response regulator [Syntrophomonadaceae bacterium]